MTSTLRTRRIRSIALATVAATVLVACGSDDDSGPVTAPPAEEPADEPAGDDTDEQPAEEPAEASGDEVHQMGPIVQETGPVSFEPGTQLAVLPDQGDDPSVGVMSPVVEGERFDGTAITIGGDQGQPVLYVFLAHWCPHCNDEIPKLIALDEDDRLPAELDVVAVSTGAAPDRSNYPPSEWLPATGWPWDSMADDENLTAIQVFGGLGFPFAVLVDDDGTVLGRRSGTASEDEIADWINGLLAA